MLQRLLVLLPFLFVCSVLPAHAEDEPSALQIPLGDRQLDAAALRAEAEATRVLRKEKPAATEGPGKALLDALDNHVLALQEAAEALEAIAGVEKRKAAIETEIASLETKRAELAARSGNVEPPEGELNEDRIQSLETGAKTAQKAAEDAGAALEALQASQGATVESLQKRIDALDQKRKELESRLAGLAEDAAIERETTRVQLDTNQVRRGVLTLRRDALARLRELESLQLERARKLAAVRQLEQQVAEMRHRAAQDAMKAQREAAAAEARRKEAEAKRELERAKARDDAAAKALAGLGLLIREMGTPLEAERTTSVNLAEVKTELGDRLTRAERSLDNSLVRFPEGESLSSRRRETLAERMRDAGREQKSLSRYLKRNLPDLRSIRADAGDRAASLEILRGVVQRERNTVHTADSLADEQAELREELEQTVNPLRARWLQARLDFLTGLTETDEQGQSTLKARWDEQVGVLLDVMQERQTLLADQQKQAEALQTTVNKVQTLVEERLRHLERIAFWVRDEGLFSSEALGRIAPESEQVGAWLSGLGTLAPPDKPVPTQDLIVLGLIALVILGVGLRLRGGAVRLPRPPVKEPEEEGDEEVSPGRRRVLRAAWLRIARQLVLPLGLALLVATVGRALLPQANLVDLIAALLFAWTLWSLANALIREFLTPDEAGNCLLPCDTRTAARARRITRLTIKGSAILLVVYAVFRSADALQYTRLTVFVWGLLAVLSCGLLTVWRDVPALLLPEGRDGWLARTVRGMTRFALPVLTLLGMGLLVVHVLGYYEASAFYTTRGLVLLLVLFALFAVHALLKLWLGTRFKKDEKEEEEAATEVDLKLGRRALGALLSLLSVVGGLVAVSMVLGMNWGDWQVIGEISLTGGDSGLTIAKLVRGLIIFLLTLGVARYIRDVLRVGLSSSKVPVGSRYVIRTLVFYVLVFIGTLMALDALGVRTDQFGWFLTAAGVGIGFGLQEIISNFISGLILFFERPVQVGDVITVGDIQGDVTKISIRCTVVRTRDGVSMILPNKKLIMEEVVNWSHGEQRTRLNIPIGVAYGSDVPLVKKILLDIARSEPIIVKWPRPEVDFTAFNDSSLDFLLRVWLPTPDLGTRRRTKTSIHTRIDEAFAENNITIPFPQRDVHFYPATEAGPEPEAEASAGPSNEPQA